ncbi:hypothetical protein [Undibacterium sp. SXout7W]
MTGYSQVLISVSDVADVSPDHSSGAKEIHQQQQGQAEQLYRIGAKQP